MTTPTTPVGGPVDTFRTTCNAEALTIAQEHGAVTLTPDDAYGLFHTLWTELRNFRYPEMIVRQEQDEDGEPVAVMECPRCGAESVSGEDAEDAVDIIDLDLRRSGFAFHGDVANPELHGYYDSSSNYELLVAECSACHDPVTIPKSVTEHC